MSSSSSRRVAYLDLARDLDESAMLTVVIATHNGASTLSSVLDAYTRLEPPRGGWKVVVADNGSTDETPTILERYRTLLPLKIVKETRRGQNWARLAALEHVEGDLIVFSDDDTIPDTRWLATLRDVADSHPDFDFFGGTINAKWESPPEAWIFRWVDLGECYTQTDPSQPEGPITPNLIWSPNMAYRRRIFDLGYKFDTSVGPSGTNYAMGSETDFNVRLGEAGFKSWFCPRAIVEHIVRRQQMTPKWVLARAKRFGRGMYRRQLLRESEAPPLLFGVPRYLLRKIAWRATRWALAAVLRRPERFSERWELNYLLGCAMQARQFYRSRGAAQQSAD
jgi:glycosyltransferase involved in cell wall biosynthesis